MANLRLARIHYLIQQATIPREGKKAISTKAIQELCGMAASYLETGEPMPEPLRLHLARALRKAEQGGNLHQAMRLKPSPGCSTDPMDQQDEDYRRWQRTEELIEQHQDEAKGKKAAMEELDMYPQHINQILKHWREAEEAHRASLQDDDNPAKMK